MREVMRQGCDIRIRQSLHGAIHLRINANAVAIAIFRHGMRQKGFMLMGKPRHLRAPGVIRQMTDTAIARR